MKVVEILFCGVFQCVLPMSCSFLSLEDLNGEILLAIRKIIYHQSVSVSPASVRSIQQIGWRLE